jgi:hypothetical protein
MASSFPFVRAGIVSAVGTAVAALAASTASAHPGHGVTPDGDSAAHYVLEPLHGLGWVVGFLVVIGCIGLVRLYRDRVTPE